MGKQGIEREFERERKQRVCIMRHSVLVFSGTEGAGETRIADDALG